MGGKKAYIIGDYSDKEKFTKTLINGRQGCKKRVETAKFPTRFSFKYLTYQIEFCYVFLHH